MHNIFVMQLSLSLSGSIFTEKRQPIKFTDEVLLLISHAHSIERERKGKKTIANIKYTATAVVVNVDITENEIKKHKREAHSIFYLIWHILIAWNQNIGDDRVFSIRIFPTLNIASHAFTSDGSSARPFFIFILNRFSV